MTSSVTVCSTCRRALVSMNTKGRSGRSPEASTRNSNVPRLVYRSLAAKRTAASMIAARSSSDSPGAGATSTSFWWRRWTLHSRSPRWATPPCRSPRICTSTCRACGRNSSTYTSGTPNAACASDRHRSYAASSSSADVTTRVPRPPPPATALTIIAPPDSDARKSPACSSDTAPSMPSSTGTPAALAAARARPLSPNSSRCSGLGPTNTIPASAQRRAKPARSARKP